MERALLAIRTSIEDATASKRTRTVEEYALGVILAEQEAFERNPIPTLVLLHQFVEQFGPSILAQSNSSSKKFTVEQVKKTITQAHFALAAEEVVLRIGVHRAFRQTVMSTRMAKNSAQKKK